MRLDRLAEIDVFVSGDIGATRVAEPDDRRDIGARALGLGILEVATNKTTNVLGQRDPEFSRPSSGTLEVGWR